MLIGRFGLGLSRDGLLGEGIEFVPRAANIY